jgi:hypothetical protein
MGEAFHAATAQDEREANVGFHDCDACLEKEDPGNVLVSPMNRPPMQQQSGAFARRRAPRRP